PHPQLALDLEWSERVARNHRTQRLDERPEWPQCECMDAEQVGPAGDATVCQEVDQDQRRRIDGTRAGAQRPSHRHKDRTGSDVPKAEPRLGGDLLRPHRNPSQPYCNPRPPVGGRAHNTVRSRLQSTVVVKVLCPGAPEGDVMRAKSRANALSRAADGAHARQLALSAGDGSADGALPAPPATSESNS